ncbi:MAG: hypothetical protein IH841_02275 [Thaumarchaeota archaeon]|nr:hypothetical protein [Nitrososphaerota archaeon]
MKLGTFKALIIGEKQMKGKDTGFDSAYYKKKRRKKIAKKSSTIKQK